MKRFVFFIIIILFYQSCNRPAEVENNSTIKQNRTINLSGSVVLKNVNIIDGNGFPIKKNRSVFIKDGIIQRIDSLAPIKKDSSFTAIDLEGKYLIPGLIESHSHICRASEDDLTKALYCGITSIRDMAGDGEYLLELKQAIENNELEAPDIYFSAVMAGPEFIKNDTRARISTPEKYELGEAPWMQKIDKNTNISTAIRKAKECGASGLKLYADLSKELVLKLTEEAHHQGLQVWSHAYVGPANVLDVTQAKVDAISHIPALLYPINWDLKKDGAMAIDTSSIHTEYLQNIIQNMRENQIVMDATLSIYKAYCNNDKKLMKIEYALTNRIYKAGIPLVAGTDNSLFLKRLNKPSLYDEIYTFVNDCGISPLDAIKFATKNGAIVLGIEKTHGTIEKGKIANLVVLDKNPLEKIENIETILLVIKNGRMINSKL